MRIRVLSHCHAVPWRQGPFALLLALPLVFACQSDSLKPPLLADQSRLYTHLELNHHAVTLSTTAPYDTLTVVAIPRNPQGETLTGLPTPQYVSQDPEHVLVTPEGRLVAVAPVSPGTLIPVVATLTAGNLKHMDSVLVSVVDNPTPPVLGSFSIHPIPPDSAKWASVVQAVIGARIDHILPVQMTDTAGMPITDAPVFFRSSDYTILSIDRASGNLTGLRPGTVTIYASTTVFGVTKADTLPYRIGFPLVGAVEVRPATAGLFGSSTGSDEIGSGVGRNIFIEPELTVGTGALIVWIAVNSDTSRATDVTFADADLPSVGAVNPAVSVNEWVSAFAPFACAYGSDCDQGGNFVLNGSVLTAGRVLTAPGTYEYHSVSQGASGRIIVLDER